jgi:hypothetical protein
MTDLSLCLKDANYLATLLVTLAVLYQKVKAIIKTAKTD